jgi:hypothetical protein
MKIAKQTRGIVGVTNRGIIKQERKQKAKKKGETRKCRI